MAATLLDEFHASSENSRRERHELPKVISGGEMLACPVQNHDGGVWQELIQVGEQLEDLGVHRLIDRVDRRAAHRHGADVLGAGGVQELESVRFCGANAQSLPNPSLRSSRQTPDILADRPWPTRASTCDWLGCDLCLR